MLLAALIWLAPLPFLAARPVPQGGYTTEKHPELGLTFPRARDYEQIPTQPDEPFVVLYYAQKVEKSAHGARPELNVVWIDEVPDKKPATGAGADAPPPPPSPEGETKPEGGSTAPGDKQAKPPINSLERWVEQRLNGFELVDGKEGKVKKGWGAREYLLRAKPVKGRPAGSARGWVYAWRGAGRTVAFVGFANSEDYDKHVEIWRESAEKVDLDEPEEASTAKLEKRYAATKLREIPFRIEVRKKLVRGWKAEDTENFIVVYDTPDVPLVRKLLGDLEVIRKEYEKLFPSVQPVTAISTVRVCKNRDEYMTYGGIPGSAGYWNSATEELVLYDAEKVVKGGGKSDADTFIVLYHEAFHQYIHYSTGELPPHSWFNEGHGDFFSGARVRDGKVRGIGPNPWRAAYIQAMVEARQSVPWGEIIHFEQADYYRGDRVGLCYAQGWAMIYFLRTSPVVAKKPEWARILPTYFDTLKSAWSEELATLEASGKKDDRVKRFESGLAARKKACETAFQGVDVEALDLAWQEFVRAMELPKSK
ncbi:MAG: hypothetical protein NTY35_02110 [Planctomycetota bacterium]|nr:hypothetical protein [Planctomycetota bacterium]